MRRWAKLAAATAAVLALAAVALAVATGVISAVRLPAAPAKPAAETVFAFPPHETAALGWTADERDRFRQAFADRFTDRGWLTRHVLAQRQVPAVGGFVSADDRADTVAARLRTHWLDPHRLAVRVVDADPVTAQPFLQFLTQYTAERYADVLPGPHNHTVLNDQERRLEMLWYDVEQTERKAQAANGERAAFELPLLKERYRQQFIEVLDARDRHERAARRRLVVLEQPAGVPN